MKDKRTEITEQDLDRLVTLSETDPEFRTILQQLDVLASKRGVELKHVIETACALYYTNKTAKEWNENRRQTI